MSDTHTYESADGKPIRRRVEVRLTEGEQTFLRDQSARLKMTMSQYILKCSVYDVQSPEGDARGSAVPLLDSLNGVWDQLREASIALSDLRDQAAYLSKDTRSALARSLSGRMLDMCDVVERDMTSAVASIGEALGTSMRRC